MVRIMLVGETGSGKTLLARCLVGEGFVPRRAMAVQYHGPLVIAPGEFLENRRFYPALITTAAHCDILLFIQDATRPTCLFPPGFAALFNRTVVGVISGTERVTADVARAQRFLHSAGVRHMVLWNAETGTGLESLKNLLL